MDTTNPHFIYGFTKRAFEAGLSEAECAAHLLKAQQDELFSDPSFAVGFKHVLNKRAGLVDGLKNWWSKATPSTRGAIVGGGIGGLGGLITGGQHKVRNALLGAGAGAGLGYMGGRWYNGLPDAGAADLKARRNNTANIMGLDKKPAPAVPLANEVEATQLSRPDPLPTMTGAPVPVDDEPNKL